MVPITRHGFYLLDLNRQREINMSIRTGRLRKIKGNEIDDKGEKLTKLLKLNTKITLETKRLGAFCHPQTHSTCIVCRRVFPVFIIF